MPTISYIIASIAIGYLVIVLLMYLLQSKMIYHPTKELTATPASVGLKYEKVQFSTIDDVNLHGWFVPADSSAPTVLYFHGNAGNISGRLETLQLLNLLGVNVLIFDYRGYGQSEGKPTEEGTYRDVTAAWKYLTNEKGMSSHQIVIMGRSLGGSIAAWLAARENAGAVVIESTFTSATDLGSDLYPWLPVRRMLKYHYPTLDYIHKIEEPLFMAHSRDDQVVPFHHGEQLFEEAKAPKRFIELQGPHAGGFMETGSKYREGLQRFLERHTSLNSEERQ